MKSKIVGLTPQDLKLIAEAGQVLSPSLESIVDEFYNNMTQYSDLTNIISRFTTTSSLKKTFLNYLTRFFSGSYDQLYEQNRIQIGRTHNRVGLSLTWYLGMYGHLEELLYAKLFPTYQVKPLKDWTDVQASIAKMIRYDQLLAVEAYVDSYTSELRRKTIEADDARRAKSLFLATVSHELRTPLSSILGYADLVLDTATEITPKTRQHLQVLHRNANSLLQLINGLIEIGKIESGKWQSDISLGDITSLLDDMATNAEGLIAGKPIEIKKNYLDRPSVHARVDFSKLRHILLNLVSNACKFTEKGSIEFDFNVANDKLQISIADSGQGIPENQYENVFVEFFRIENKKIPGSGLGLSLVKTLVTSMNGTIEIAPNSPHGCIFTVRLPILLDQN